MGEGYIPISRAIFEHQFWCKRRVFSKFEAWLYLIKEARFEDAKICDGNKTVLVKRGQVYASVRFLASAFGWSPKKVLNFLNLLASDNGIKKETVRETGQTLITLCNYDAYNSVVNEKETGKKTTRKRDGNGTETKYKELNKENNTKEKIYKKEKFDLSFCDASLLPVFLEWLEYKAGRRESYQTQKSIEAAYKKLFALSGGNPETARKVVEESMASNYAGLFELKAKPTNRFGLAQ